VKLPTMTVATAVLLFATQGHAQSVKMKEEKPGLLQRAKITPAAATTSARTKIPKGKVVSAEIEEENGKLLYSFDIKTVGKTGIDEVNVDAMTGEILSVQHETPKDEAREKAADRK